MHAEKRTPSRGENLITVVAVAIPAVWMGFIVQAYLRQAAEKQEVASGISNCRQIITAMRIYSAENFEGYDGARPPEGYKPPASSNEAFRALFTGNILDNETIFGCPHSPYQPDGKIGTAPHFEDALAPGENHWMMTIGISDSASGNIPLVYENAAVAEWNPKWNANARRKPVSGRTWTKGIIIGMNDSSVSLQKLAATEGSEVPLKSLGAGGEENLFTQHDNFEVLDVARKAK